MDDSENVYFNFILFTFLMTSIISIFYLYFFDIKTNARFIDRIFKIYAVVLVIFFILQKKGYSLWKMFKLATLIFIILYILCFLYMVIDYFRYTRASNRGKALRLFGLFLGLLLIIGMRKSLMLEVESLFDF